jgi:hypothetical protein
MNDTILNLPARLRQHKRGHPSAKIPWPHSILEKAATRIDALQAENEKLKRHIHAAMDRIDSDDVIGAYTALLGSESVKENSDERRG